MTRTLPSVSVLGSHPEPPCWNDDHVHRFTLCKIRGCIVDGFALLFTDQKNNRTHGGVYGSPENRSYTISSGCTGNFGDGSCSHNGARKYRRDWSDRSKPAARNIQRASPDASRCIGKTRSGEDPHP